MERNHCTSDLRVNVVAGWRRFIGGAFPLMGMTRSSRNWLEKNVMESVSWKAHHDSNAQRLMQLEEEKWNEWRRLLRMNKRMKFEKTESAVEESGGTPVIMHMDGNTQVASEIGVCPANESKEKEAKNPQECVLTMW